MAAGRLRRITTNRVFWSGVVSVLVFLLLWEIGARSKQWLSYEMFTPFRDMLLAMGFKGGYLPWIGAVPPPSAVLKAWLVVLREAG